MALSPAAFLSGFNTYNTFTGPATPGLLLSIATGTYNWIMTPGSVKCTSITTGSAGAGNILGVITCPPPVVPTLVALASAKGLSGTAAPTLISTIARGFQQGMLSAQYSGLSPSVSTGADILKVVVVKEADLQANILSCMPGVGPATPMFCSAIASVICSVALTCIGSGVITPVGPVAPSPSTGEGKNLTIF